MSPIVFALAALALGARDASAQWIPDGAPVTTAAKDQRLPSIVEDGAGGVIVVWQDTRRALSTDWNVYAQRLDAGGVPLWVTNGISLCTAPDDQIHTNIVSDGAGGAIVVWEDFRDGVEWQVFAQRIDASGIPQWAADGVAVLGSFETPVFPPPSLVEDGAGGAIVIVQTSGASTGADVFAQRLDAGGAPVWTSGGVAVCTAPGDQFPTSVVSDGAGGAILAWEDRRGADPDIYAARVAADGTTPWTADGVALCTAPDTARSVQLVADGAGGAIAAWQDARTPPYYTDDIYAQRVDASGATLWTPDGVPLTTAAGWQADPVIASDGAGGAIVAWDGGDILAQRVDASGATRWTTDGIPVCTLFSYARYPCIVPDGAGGAVVAWQDSRYYPPIPYYDVFARRILPSGGLVGPPGGIPMTAAPFSQQFAVIASDGDGGAIVAWEDMRVSSLSFDIYAQRFSFAAVSAPGIPPPSGGLELAAGGANPSSGDSWLRLVLPAPEHVVVTVHDAGGRRVATVASAVFPGGSTRLRWDGRTDAGGRAAAGVYFARAEGASGTVTRKVTRIPE